MAEKPDEPEALWNESRTKIIGYRGKGVDQGALDKAKFQDTSGLVAAANAAAEERKKPKPVDPKPEKTMFDSDESISKKIAEWEKRQTAAQKKAMQ